MAGHALRDFARSALPAGNGGRGSDPGRYQSGGGVGTTQPAIDSDGDHQCRDGRVAYVNPPQRPGATLWSIAAGPLVNVALLPILIAAVVISRSLGWAQAMPDVYQLLRAVLWIDVSLLVFNMLPIYPLDGGQILRSLLWFGLGRARSLMVATILGLMGIVGFFGLALWVKSEIQLHYRLAPPK